MLEFAYQFLMLERVRECEDVETPGTETHKLAKMPPETQRVRREEQMEESLFSFPRCSGVGLKLRSILPVFPAGSAPYFILHPADSTSITLSDATAPCNTVLQALA
ncbi:uncharacterized [Tachysurus ichikawai]